MFHVLINRLVCANHLKFEVKKPTVFFAHNQELLASISTLPKPIFRIPEISVGEEFLEFPPVELTMVICVLASSFIVAVGTLPFLAEPGFEDVRAVLDGLENSICIFAGLWTGIKLGWQEPELGTSLCGGSF